MTAGFEELLIIDRGLRSSASWSLQEETLGRIVPFYRQYRGNEEILQALLLRLVEYFRICPAERRLRLVDVFEGIAEFPEMEIHPDIESWRPIKVKGAPELARRLITQWESNEVLKKSLVIRLFRLFDFEDDVEMQSNSPGFSCCSGTAASVYYRIGQSLRSRSPEEHVEAVFTSLCLAQRSRGFALYIVDAAIDLLQDPFTLSDIRVLLIRLFQYARGDVAASVRVHINNASFNEFCRSSMQSLRPFPCW